MAGVSPRAEDVAATFCATLVDEWARAGVRHAFVAPGSRSTPMALALAANQRIGVSIHHDERSAAFAALGAGLATGRPAVVLTTSGTAAAELHAAVVEAHQAHVPMIIVTADRPPEMRDVGAPQTIDQHHLYGRAVRWFIDPGLPDAASSSSWRSLGARAVLEATSARPGPVHINLPFREPLIGTPGALPRGRPRGAAWHVATSGDHDGSRTLVVDRGHRGLVIAGRGSIRWAREISALGWPVLADARAGLGGVAHADPLLRVGAFAAAHRPETILRIGEPPASRVVNEWVDGCGARQVVLAGTFVDPARDAAEFGARLRVNARRPAPRGWRAVWQRADTAAARAINAVLDGSRAITEPGIARSVVIDTPAGSHVVVASSMPIRDVEWYAPRRAGTTVHANRGANGIDGVVSTALGFATINVPTVALVGDLAFLHDSSALVALARRPVDLTVVVVDNDGGGIFSFLPQATALGAEQFEQLFGTPHGTDCAGVARAHGLRTTEPTTPAALARALGTVRGPRVLVARSDRQRNVEVHRLLNESVASALHSVL